MSDTAPYYMQAFSPLPRRCFRLVSGGEGGGPTTARSRPSGGPPSVPPTAYIAPVLIGAGGKPALAGPGALNIADAKRFQLEDVIRIGPDVRLTATPLS